VAAFHTRTVLSRRVKYVPDTGRDFLLLDTRLLDATTTDPKNIDTGPKARKAGF
jgi:hypothetical protein